MQCSVTCSRGVKTRQVACVDDELGHVIDDYHCDAKKPRHQAACRRGRCPHWVTSRWSQVRSIVSTPLALGAAAMRPLATSTGCCRVAGSARENARSPNFLHSRGREWSIDDCSHVAGCVITPPPIRERSIVMSVSVCVCVCVCVCVFVCPLSTTTAVTCPRSRATRLPVDEAAVRTGSPPPGRRCATDPTPPVPVRSRIVL